MIAPKDYIVFTSDEKASPVCRKLIQFIELRIQALRLKNENIGLPTPETEGIRRAILEYKNLLLKLKPEEQNGFIHSGNDR